MARTMMPKSGVVMPYVVVSRDTTIAGVASVDGQAGVVNLTGKYLTKQEASNLYVVKSSIDTLLTAYLKKTDAATTYLPKMNPTLPLNSTLRAVGANGVGEVDLLNLVTNDPVAANNNRIILGEAGKQISGVEIHSQGRVAIHANTSADQAGAPQVYPLYSTRFRPEANDVTAASIGNYVRDANGWITRVNITGINSDIKELRGLSTPLTSAQGGTGTAGLDDPTSTATPKAKLETRYPQILLNVSASGATPRPSHAKYTSMDSTPAGTYYFGYNNITDTSNPPHSGIVHDYYSLNQDYRVQTITSYSGVAPKTSYRTKNGDNHTWGRWIHYARGDDITPPTGVTGWVNATRNFATQMWFTTQPDSIGNKAPWGIGINEQTRQLHIFSGLVESATPDYNDPVQTAVGGKQVVFEADVRFPSNIISHNGGPGIALKPDGATNNYIRFRDHAGVDKTWIGNDAPSDPGKITMSSTAGGNRIDLNSDGTILLQPGTNGAVGITKQLSLTSSAGAATSVATVSINQHSNSNVDAKRYLRGFRSFTGATMWWETVQGSVYRLATGAADSTEIYNITGTDMNFHGRIAAGNLNATGTLTAGNIVYTGTINSATVRHNAYFNAVDMTSGKVGTAAITSDRRLKSDIKPLEIEGKLDKINAYTYIKDGKKETGLIAQEVQEVMPDAVEDYNDKLYLNYNSVIALLVAEMKELKAEVNSLKQEVAELKEAK